MEILLFLFGFVCGILGTIIWAVFQVGGEQSREEETAERAFNNKK